jgi:hypothetical protein
VNLTGTFTGNSAGLTNRKAAQLTSPASVNGNFFVRASGNPATTCRWQKLHPVRKWWASQPFLRILLRMICWLILLLGTEIQAQFVEEELGSAPVQWA